LSFYRSNSFGGAIIIFALPLLVASYYGLKIMSSVYKTDLGNGVVIYADDYVSSGRWVFYCNKSRLISRQPLPTPIAELEQAGRITIGDMYYLSDIDEAQAKEAIKTITGIEQWYKKLHYRYSVLGENSELKIHVYNAFVPHNGRSWALKVWQWLDQDKSSFEISAEPYDPETYMDYAKSLQAAAKSCPVPQ
jgi:hypothetical protein